MDDKIYPKIGGTLTFASQKMAAALDMLGVIICLNRGQKEQAEIGMCFNINFRIISESFRRLTQSIVDDKFSVSLSKPHKACVMFAEATGSESVIIFWITKSGDVQIGVSHPLHSDLVAGIALKIASSFDEMN